MTGSTHITHPKGALRWARLLAWFTGGLLLVGGLVTTYRVGMAVYDWPTTFGYAMFSYPLDQMIRDFGVTVEHSHRMFASLVGMVSLILVMVATARTAKAAVQWVALAVTMETLLVFEVIRVGGIGGTLQVAMLGLVVLFLLLALRSAESRGPRAIATAVHLAIIGQGLLGGTRVLEDSGQLAFLHGSAAQVVFLLAAMATVICAPSYRTSEPASREGSQGLVAIAWLAAVLVYVQIVIGAWLRHTGLELPLMLHLFMAFGATAAVLLLARKLQTVASDDPADPLRRMRRNLLALLSIQILLGFASLVAIQVISGGFTGKVSAFEAVSASLHVLVGAMLLGSCAQTALWCRRILSPVRAEVASGELVLEGGVR